MGTALARLNFVCGFDGRDVKFVMGGCATSPLKDPAFYVIDFNQMRRLSQDEDMCVAEIVAAISDDDRYLRAMMEKLNCGTFSVKRISLEDVQIATRVLAKR